MSLIGYDNQLYYVNNELAQVLNLIDGFLVADSKRVAVSFCLKSVLYPCQLFVRCLLNITFSIMGGVYNKPKSQFLLYIIYFRGNAEQALGCSKKLIRANKHYYCY